MRNTGGISKTFLTLGVLVALLAMGMPGKAWAQVAAQPSDCGSDNTNAMDTSFQAAAAVAAQEKIQARQSIIMAYGQHTVGACWSKIQSLFAAVGSINGVVGALVNIIMQQILAVVNQACQAALNLTNQITQYAQRELASLTCIPLPKLGLGLNAINLGLGTPPPCNGVSLLGGPSMAPRTGYIWQLLLPQSSGTSGSGSYIP